jgi:hypothetical protein
MTGSRRGREPSPVTGFGHTVDRSPFQLDLDLGLAVADLDLE